VLSVKLFAAIRSLPQRLTDVIKSHTLIVKQPAISYGRGM